MFLRSAIFHKAGFSSLEIEWLLFEDGFGRGIRKPSREAAEHK